MFARGILNYPTMGWRHPFAELERMSRQMDRLTQGLLGRPGLGWRPASVFPAINLTEDADSYYVRAELPGIKADALDIQAVGRKLTISGERTIASEGENVRYHRREREAGKFSRTIGMPGDIDANKVDAKLANGMLKVTIAKAEAAKPKQITIH
ncbi:molecular chaperone Hsp20 [Desulfosarcina widdelii]|uniref:Molecular chaperone Hsp20 n=1 Tax=Desulfosarcina widdelii TaxID=947919 RepID=A0A5K7Z3V2_9BACT|nr:Hsp20/alpha crystallin family protein [Desulfosarcina widdelii]BBO74241.1 molecular chaperone Hsp20 [Desulfosarcina widdelii]